MQKELIYVAKVGKSVGLNGELKLYIDSDFPEQFCSGATFSTNKSYNLTIKSYNPKKSTVKFEGIDDVDSAKKLTNTLLYTTKEASRQNCTLDEKEFFWFDIVGLDIYEDDIILGKVKDIQRFAIDDFLEVKTSDEFINKGYPKSFLIPYIDRYIIKVDLQQNKIITKDCFEILQNS